MNNIYEQLKTDPRYADKITYNEQENRVEIAFHEYLRLFYYAGEYDENGEAKGGHNQGAVFVEIGTGNLWSYHIFNEAEAFVAVAEVFSGDRVIIEDLSGFGRLWQPRKTLTKEKFAKKKEKLMTKKSLRIFTGIEILKRND